MLASLIEALQCHDLTHLSPILAPFQASLFQRSFLPGAWSCEQPGHRGRWWDALRRGRVQPRAVLQHDLHVQGKLLFQHDLHVHCTR